MSPVRLFRLPAVLALAAAVALSRPSAAFGAEDGQIALTVDGRPMPVAPEVIASNKADVTVRATRISMPLVRSNCSSVKKPLLRPRSPKGL